MKVFIFGLLLAFANASPLPLDEEVDGPVEFIVNGVPEGEALEIGHILDIQLNKHADGQVVASSDLLYPLTAQGLADIALAQENTPERPDVEGLPLPELLEPSPEVVVPGPIVLPMPVLPEVQPEPEVVPGPIIVPMPVLPEEQAEPEVVPGPIVLPMPVLPIVQPEPEVVEESVPQIPNGEIFNDGNVQVIVNGPEQPSVLSSIQSWFQMVLNYFSNGVQTSQQIF
ncbi:PREDICTED: actin cytoskeleton-regulatory complex protein PAN1-like [Papilio polytes]|uniref:actin cytoskeleton-regulatory complex protein PAN1-like n=1 Tax=Papilio polytes TaxID=76194 RepID=UPI00067654CE|nr:PREDICTED: actin cytoskeleton-regulatory complex protein PAN1-like [Papilio polytes]